MQANIYRRMSSSFSGICTCIFCGYLYRYAILFKLHFYDIRTLQYTRSDTKKRDRACNSFYL